MKIELDKALEEISRLRRDRDHYKSTADTLQEALEDTEAALRAAKGQLAILCQDRRYEVAEAI